MTQTQTPAALFSMFIAENKCALDLASAGFIKPAFDSLALAQRALDKISGLFVEGDESTHVPLDDDTICAALDLGIRVKAFCLRVSTQLEGRDVASDRFADAEAGVL